MRALAMLFVLASLAGCLDQPVVLDADSFTLAVTGPDTTFVGVPITLTMTATGPERIDSDHIGAHYWTAPGDPQAAFDMRAGDCQHGGADIAGTHAVLCTFAATGTYHVYGHVRISVDGEPVNYWAAGHMVTVHSFSLSTDSAGSTATTGEPYQFTMSSTGSTTMTSDHIGAHFWLAPVDDPTASFADRAGNCDHTAGDAPGTYTVTCTWDTPDTYYVYGHLRLTAGAVQANYWTGAIVVEVTDAAGSR